MVKQLSHSDLQVAPNVTLRLAETLTLYSTVAYYKILQYLCVTKTHERPNPDYNVNNKKKHIKHGNDKQKA